MKSLDEMQQEQKELISGVEHPRLGDVLGLTEEVGELAKEVMEIEMYGENRQKELGIEVADVLFSLISLCNSYSLDLAAVYQDKLTTIREKVPEWHTKYGDSLKKLRDKYD